MAQAGGSFWLRARMNTEQFHGKSLDPSALAIVQYDSAGHKGHLKGRPMLKQLPDSRIWPLMQDKVGESRKKSKCRRRLLVGCCGSCPLGVGAGLLTPLHARGACV